MNTDGYGLERGSHKARGGRKGLLGGSVGKRDRVDLMKGPGGAITNLAVGIHQGVCEGGDGAGGLRTELREGCCRGTSDVIIRAFQGGDEGWDRNLRGCRQVAEKSDCHPPDLSVRVGNTVGDCRYNKYLGSVVRSADFMYGGEGSHASWVVGVCDECQQWRQGVCSEVAQSHGGSEGYIWSIRVIGETTQVIEGWHGSCSQSVEGLIGAYGELPGSRIEKQAGKLADRRKSVSIERIGECSSPTRRLVLNPLHEERKSRNADVVDSLGCFLVLGRGIGAGTPEGFAQHFNPIAEGMSVIGGFAWGGLVCEQDKDCHQRADGAEEKHLLLTHAQNMQRRGPFLTEESGAGRGLGSEPSTLNSQLHLRWCGCVQPAE